MRSKLSLKSLLIFNGGMHALAQGIRLIITLITIPILLNYLGKETFGLWMISLSFISLIGFLQGGLSGAMINVVAHADDGEDLSHRVSTALTLTSLIALTLIPLAAIIAYYVSWRTLFSAEDLISRSNMSRLIFVLLCSFAISFVTQVPRFTLIGNMKAYAAHAIEVIAIIISGGSILLSVYFKQPLWVIAFAFAFGRQIPLLIMGLILMKWQLNLSNLSKPHLDPKFVKTLLTSGGLLAVVQASYGLANHSDLTLIGIYGNLEGAGDYSIMQRVFSIPMLILLFVSLALWPAFAKAKASGSISWIKRVFTQNLLALTSFAIIFSVIVGLSIDPLLVLWLGERQDVDPLLIWGMVAWVIITVPVGAANEFLKSMDEFRLLAYLCIAMVVLNIPISIYLIKIHGEAGAVLGSVIANTICLAIPLTIMIPKVLRKMKANKIK